MDVFVCSMVDAPIVIAVAAATAGTIPRFCNASDISICEECGTISEEAGISIVGQIEVANGPISTTRIVNIL